MHALRTSWVGTLLIAAFAASVAGSPGVAAARAVPAPPAERDARAAADVVRSQNAFALELYQRIASRDVAVDRFLSPYSVFTVLTMTAEGARGRTADELGRVLHLGPALRRHGADAAARPWDLAPVHAGLGALVASLEPADTADAAGIRARIATLRATLAAANDSARSARSSGPWRKWEQAQAQVVAAATELNQLEPRVDRYELRVASALWGESTVPFAPAFARTLAGHYRTGGVRGVDFRGHAEDARRTINDWAAEQTAQRIRDLLPPGSVSPATRLVLTNAIYFKGEWSEVFDAGATHDQPFHLGDGGRRDVALMNATLHGARYAAFRADGTPFPTPRFRPLDGPDAAPGEYPGSSGFQVVELPYKGGDLAMDVLLPGSPQGLAALERLLTAERLAAWLGQLERRPVITLLPRMRLELGGSLVAPLRAMGMARAFADPARGDGADLGGMTTGSDGGLYVSDVIHKAFLEVNERGTEAAAATGAVMEVSAARPTRLPFTPTFRADRPFLFLIRDTRSGCILFVGRFARP